MAHNLFLTTGATTKTQGDDKLQCNPKMRITKPITKFFRRMSFKSNVKDSSKEREEIFKTSLSLSEDEAETTWVTMDEIHAVHVSLAKCSAKSTETLKLTDQELQEKRIEAAKQFVARMNAHRITSIAELMTKDSYLHFLNQAKELDAELSWDCWSQAMEQLNESFPDFNVQYQNIVYKCGAVVMQGFRAGGTHTGKPFAFGPCEPIETTGIKVLNDPEEILFFFHEGQDKIARFIVAPRGEMTGPAGFYTQLGGFPLL